MQEWSQYYIENSVKIHQLTSLNFPSSESSCQSQCAPGPSIGSQCDSPSSEHKPMQHDTSYNPRIDLPVNSHNPHIDLPVNSHNPQNDPVPVRKPSSKTCKQKPRLKSPELPTLTVKCGQGYKFTEQDKKYAEV
jgi:hypothetical protein